MTGLKIMALYDLWVRDQMKISRVHIRVTKHLFLYQGSESGQYARFPCSTLAAYDNQFLHSNLLRFSIISMLMILPISDEK
jgi:hypothetical protein